MNKKLLFPLMAVTIASLACNMLTRNASSTPSATSEPQIQPAITPSEAADIINSESDDGVPLSGSEINNHASHILQDVVYCTMDGVPLYADIYFPKNRSAITPLLIYIHGGGWRSGSRNGGAGMMDIPALLDAGFTIASIDYRLAPDYKMPAMIEDVKCAVRSFRAHAADYKIDPNRIGAWGSSAGGHLVSILGTSDESAGFDVGEYLNYSSRVQAVVDMFGPVDFLTFPFNQHSSLVASTVFGTADLSDPIFAAASPVTYISTDDPPFLILQGDLDRTVPLSQSQEFYDKLTDSGVDAQLVIVNGGDHGLKAPGESPSRAELTQKIVEFFTLKLK